MYMSLHAQKKDKYPTKEGVQQRSKASHTQVIQERQLLKAIQLARVNPKAMTSGDVIQLQSSFGNRAVIQLLNSSNKAKTGEGMHHQANLTGLPDNLKAGVESLSGLSMDAVMVHYNSSKPAQVGALAYTQGTDIHVGPGQEKHLSHEAWHVVQQAQGRVHPTMQLKGVAVNDDAGLEREADIMSQQLQIPNSKIGQNISKDSEKSSVRTQSGAVQFALAGVQDINPDDLSVHKTAIDAANTAVGRGAAAIGSGKPLKTNIKWKALHPDTGEGTGVECTALGPDHPLGSDTSGNTGISGRTKLINDIYEGYYKQGHLLNAKLGGPGGEKKNLVAIPADANAQMSTNCEGEMQNRINIAGQWLHFKVDVTHTSMSAKAGKHLDFKGQRFYASKLDIAWGPIDDDGNKAGETKKLIIDIPEPVKKSKKSGASVSTPSTLAVNANPGAITQIGEYDIVLDDSDAIKRKFEQKIGAAYQKEFEVPPSPLRQEEMDTKMDEDFAGFKHLNQFSPEDPGRLLKYLAENKAIAGAGSPYAFQKSSIGRMRETKAKPAYNYPERLYALITATPPEKVLPILDLAEVKDCFPELQKLVKLSCKHADFDHDSIILLTTRRYIKDPKKFKLFYDLLSAKLAIL